MKNDVSGNDVIEVKENIEDVENDDDMMLDGEENNDSNIENIQSEIAVVNTYDYTSNFQSIENNLAINNALILACILLIGVLCGLRKL